MNLPDIAFMRPGAWWLLIVLVVCVAAARLLNLHSRSRLQDGLRTAVLLLLIVTLTGPMLVAGARETTTIFVVDRSASVQSGSATAANDWITTALAQANVDANSAIITFGPEPTLSQPVVPANAVGDAWQDVTTMGDATDLASALSLARSLPVGDNRRIVVLSDGEETTGSALGEASRAGEDGVAIDVVPLSGIDGTDMRIETVTGPASTWQGEAVSLVVQVGANGGGVATLDLFVDGIAVGSSQVTLRPGSTIVQLSVPAPEPGFHAIAVQVSGPADIDRIVENNVGYHGVIVRDKPEVLLVTPVGADSTRLQQALEAEGAVVSLVEPSAVSASTAELSAWDAVVLNNVPAWDLSHDQQTAIVTHTEAGNGLIVLGGSASYGPGSYAGTPLEEAMPVTVKVVDGQRRPSVAVLIIMDKSGSMSYDPSSGTTSKIDLAKNGVVTAASALAPGDQLGVIAFNDEPVWALPMMTLTGSGDMGLVEDSLAALSADGGTELYPALQVGYDAMRNVDADVRHIILLSDGKSRSGTRETYQRLVSDLGNDNITLSTVALGTDADLDLLEFLSTNGGGRYHYANTPEEIPQITFQEAQNAGSQSVLRGAFGPVQEQASPILNDIDVASMPPIDGYNFAEGRGNAQVDLVSDRGDPLLAKWQLGLGRVVAWTADDGSDYASGWAAWDEYDRFWGATLRWTLPDPSNQAITSSIVRDGSHATLTLDTQLAGGDAIVLDEKSVDVTYPDGATVSVPLRLLESGRYEGTVPGPLAGSYLIGLPSRNLSMANALPVSPEWLPSGEGSGLLAEIASRTGGTVRSLDEPPAADLFAATADGARAPGTVRAIWPYPLTLALALFVVEIGLRQSRLWHDDSRATSTGSAPPGGA